MELFSCRYTIAFKKTSFTENNSPPSSKQTNYLSIYRWTMKTLDDNKEDYQNCIHALKAL